MTDRDPLEDPPRPGRCPEPRCDMGWIKVTPEYVVHQMHLGDVHLDTAASTVKAVALADSWYPCRTCNRRLFFRWVGGHYNPGHDEANCDECIDIRSHGRRKGLARAAAREERRDLI